LHAKDEAECSRLLRAGLAGDERSYADFLQHAAGHVRGYARRRIVHGGIDPEDIVQETLLAIHLKRHTWRTDAPVAPWLYAIAGHKLKDAFRRKGRRPEVSIPDDFDVAAEEAPEYAREQEIDRALGTLAPSQKAVVASISVEGRSIAETATRLGMTEGAVRVSLHRGLAAIARRFAR
jgi:RNA polymerase sigma-70 factor (ECF subfamily)